MADWLSKSRTGQLNMAKVWHPIMQTKGGAWGIPQNVTDEFGTVLGAADQVLQVAVSSDRTPAITAECQRVFGELVAKMRFIKDRYFKKPPLKDEDFTSLLLDIPNQSRTPRGPPKAQMTAEIGRSGTAMLILRYRYAEGTEALANPHTDLGHQVRWGVLPPIPGGEGVRNLSRVPKEPEELPMVLSTARKKDIIYFDAADSGKTAYFCIRIENGSGQYGPWCPIFHAVVP